MMSLIACYLASVVVAYVAFAALFAFDPQGLRDYLRMLPIALVWPVTLVLIVCSLLGASWCDTRRIR